MNTKLQAALVAAGMSQSELARRLGVDQPQVNHWVARRRRPSVSELAAAVQELGVDGPKALGYWEDKEVVVRDLA